MKQLKYILPLLLTIITLAIYNPIKVQGSTQYTYSVITGDPRINTDGSFGANAGFRHSSLIQIQNNSVIFNTNNFHFIMLYNNGNYVGYYIDNNLWPGNSLYLGTLSQFNPNLATHFRIGADVAGTSWSIPLQVSVTDFTNNNITYSNPTPYTIQPKDPFAQYKEVKRIFNDINNTNQFWHDDNGILRGTLAGENDLYADRTNPFNLSHEMLYLNIPLPSNITQAGTYDLWFTLFDYNDQFVGTYRPTSNNISTITLSNLGAYYIRINYTENYKTLPSWDLFSYAKYNSENAWLQTFYNSNGTVLIQLHNSPTNLYQPNSNLLYIDDTQSMYDVRTYLTNNNIPLPTKEGHTLIGFQRDLGAVDIRFLSANQIDTNYIFSAGENKLYYPIFEQNLTYQVTFTDYDDSVIEVITVSPGETAIPTQLPTRTGYVFAYWEPPVTDIQGNLTTKAIYYVPITWRNADFATIRIDQVIEGQMPMAPELQGYTRTWTPTIVVATEPTQYVLVSETLDDSTSSGVTPTPPSGNQNATSITDLFTGVFGGIIGALMIIGTIDLYGIELSSLFWLFFAGTGFFMMWKFLVR
jgi:hypothetical protein